MDRWKVACGERGKLKLFKPWTGEGDPFARESYEKEVVQQSAAEREVAGSQFRRDVTAVKDADRKAPVLTTHAITKSQLLAFLTSSGIQKQHGKCD